MPKLLLSRRVWIAAFLLPGLLLTACPSLAATLGLDVWNLPRLKQSVEEARARAVELETQNREVHQRIAIKEALVSELIAGRMTLEDASHHFVALNESYPEYMMVIRATYPGDSDMEKVSRNVINFASLRIGDDAERDRLIARLELERDQFVRPAPAQGARRRPRSRPGRDRRIGTTLFSSPPSLAFSPASSR